MIKESPSTWLCEKDYVWVINRTYGGTFIVEGKAAVLKVLGEDRALVCFDNGDKVERFIEKEAQANPEEYVAMLNRCESKYSDTVAMHMIQKILDGTDWKKAREETAERQANEMKEMQDKTLALLRSYRADKLVAYWQGQWGMKA